MSEPVIVDRVTKRFSGHTAVDGLSLSVAPGIIYGLLGPNGAGKTTTLRMIMDIYEPDSGSIRLFDQVGGGRTHSARIGYLPEERGLYPRMRVLDVLVFLAEAKGVSRRAARVKALEWLERLGLADWRLRKVSDLSKGMQQKVQFISTVLHDPDLVIFDEPFSGLDPVNSQVLRDTVVDYRRRGKTVLFSTHIMEHAEKLCDRLCIIARGKKLIDGTLAEVKGTHGGKHVIVAFDGNQGNARQIFSDRRLVAKIQDFGQEAELELAPGADAQEILKALVNSGARLARFELASPSLHKIFVDLVGPEAATAAATAPHAKNAGSPRRQGALGAKRGESWARRLGPDSDRLGSKEDLSRPHHVRKRCAVVPHCLSHGDPAIHGHPALRRERHELGFGGEDDARYRGARVVRAPVPADAGEDPWRGLRFLLSVRHLGCLRACAALAARPDCPGAGGRSRLGAADVAAHPGRDPCGVHRLLPRRLSSLFRDVRGGGRDVEQRAGGAPGAAASHLRADDFLPVHSRAHERSQLDIREDALARAIHHADRDTRAVDSGKHADVGTGDVARYPRPCDRRGDMGCRPHLSRGNPDDG